MLRLSRLSQVDNTRNALTSEQMYFLKRTSYSLLQFMVFSAKSFQCFGVSIPGRHLVTKFPFQSVDLAFEL